MTKVGWINLYDLKDWKLNLYVTVYRTKREAINAGFSEGQIIKIVLTY